ncbi:MAG: CDP-alcohol phosphatidyltransferase family protein [Acidimicrobiia bacterium]|nr:CDP-alcohol phosphatidyltransferase family protein [Acidimicrobiia bacterium]
MTEERASSRVLTVPNLVSFLRVLLVPVFWWLLLGLDDVRGAAALMLFIGTTDWVDGYLARRLDQVSKLGKILDPVADRLMIASAVVAGLVADVLPEVIVWPLIARELFMGLVTFYLASRGAGALAVRYLGKFATFVLYGAIPSFYLAASDVLPEVFNPLAWFTGVIGVLSYWIVAFQYVGDARRALSGLESRPVEMER